MATLIDSYSETNQNGGAPLNSNTAYGQAFNNPSSATLDSAKFYMKIRTGSPSGDMLVKIYASTGTLGTTAKPTGAVLATSDAVNANTLTSSYALITFNFSGANRITLNASTDYIVTVWYPTGVADVTDLLAGDDTTSPTHGGNYSETGDAGSNWSAFSTVDLCFYIYKADAAGGASHHLGLLGVGA